MVFGLPKGPYSAWQKDHLMRAFNSYLPIFPVLPVTSAYRLPNLFRVSRCPLSVIRESFSPGSQTSLKPRWYKPSNPIRLAAKLDLIPSLLAAEYGNPRDRIFALHTLESTFGANDAVIPNCAKPPGICVSSLVRASWLLQRQPSR